MGVSKNRGGPPKWMVKIMVPNPMNKWMIWGVKTFLETPISSHLNSSPSTLFYDMNWLPNHVASTSHLINRIVNVHIRMHILHCRVPKGGVFKGGGNWGTLRIPREDWGTLGNIRED